jgi:integrase
MRAFPVTLPSGVRYWTVLDEDLAVVGDADAFLRQVRFGRDDAELTTKAYAGGIALYLRWCLRTGRDWQIAAADMGLFITWLRHAPQDVSGLDVSAGAGQLLVGPGREPVRGARRINNVLTSVRGFLSHAITAGQVPSDVLAMLYELADDRSLPVQARGEATGLSYRLRVRHRLVEPERPVDRASDEEIVALLRACRSCRDRLIVLLMARTGLRRGELTGLRRSDVHFLVDSGPLGCPVKGAHLHVVRRDNPNGAWAKSRRHRAVPVDFLGCRRSTSTSSSATPVLGLSPATSSWSICFENRSGRRCRRMRSTSSSPRWWNAQSWIGRSRPTCSGTPSGAISRTPAARWMRSRSCSDTLR